MKIAAALSIWRRWWTTFSIGLLDQAVFSGANFFLNILLARWLSTTEYGAFAVAFSILILLSGPHAALLSDPLNVVGPRRFAGHYTPYLRALFVLHAALSIPLGIAIAGAGVLLHGITNLSSTWFIVVGLATPLVLSSWLARGMCYLETRPKIALSGSVLYAFSLLGLAAVAHAGSFLSGPLSFALLAIAGIVSSARIAIALGLMAPASTTANLSEVVAEHWSYGRWILGSAVASGIASGLYAPLLGAFAGLDQTAAFRVLQNLILPLQQVLTAITLVAYPLMSRNVAQRGIKYLIQRGPAFVLVGVGLSVAYGLAISAFAAPLFAVLYGTGRYTSYSGLTSLIALAGIAAGLAQFLGILVRVMNQPQAVFWAKLAAAVWLAVAGVSLVRGGGVRGALLSLVGGSAVEALVVGFVLVRIVMPHAVTAHE